MDSMILAAGHQVGAPYRGKTNWRTVREMWRAGGSPSRHGCVGDVGLEPCSRRDGMTREGEQVGCDHATCSCLGY